MFFVEKEFDAMKVTGDINPAESVQETDKLFVQNLAVDQEMAVLLRGIVLVGLGVSHRRKRFENQVNEEGRRGRTGFSRMGCK